MDNPPVQHVAPIGYVDTFTIRSHQSPSEVVDWLRERGQRVIGAHLPPPSSAHGVCWQGGPNELVRMGIVGDTLAQIAPGVVVVVQ